MNKISNISSIVFVFMALLCVSCISCSKDDDTPMVESVWKNMTSEPIVQTTYAYPNQTLCLRGSGLSGLKKIIVNDTEVDVSGTLIYDTDHSITFRLPSDVNITAAGQPGYIRVITNHGECTYQPFLVKSNSEKPAIRTFSNTKLVPGTVLTITGSNLGGAKEVWLPLAYEQKVLCEFDPEQPSTEKAIYVIVPLAVDYARGVCEIVMEKENALGGTFSERAYSSITDFSN